MGVRYVVGVLLFDSIVIQGCDGTGHEQDRPRPRLVLLYATCSVNRTFLSPSGKAPSLPSELGRFASPASVFDRHQTESGESGTAFASIFTSLQAPGHGGNCQPTRLYDSVATIAEAFARAGFETGSRLLDSGGGLGESGGGRRVPGPWRPWTTSIKNLAPAARRTGTPQ